MKKKFFLSSDRLFDNEQVPVELCMMYLKRYANLMGKV